MPSTPCELVNPIRDLFDAAVRQYAIRLTCRGCRHSGSSQAVSNGELCARRALRRASWSAHQAVASPVNRPITSPAPPLFDWSLALLLRRKLRCSSKSTTVFPSTVIATIERRKENALSYSMKYTVADFPTKGLYIFRRGQVSAHLEFGVQPKRKILSPTIKR